MTNGSPKIFVLDDEKAFLEEMHEMLGLSGYDVCISTDNENAVEKIKKFDPQVLLMDLKMTPRSGFQIAHEIKNSLHWHHLIIIAMSGYFLEKEHLALMQECGIKSFLAKPFKPLNLISTIENEVSHLRVTSRPSEPAKSGSARFSPPQMIRA